MDTWFKRISNTIAKSGMAGLLVLTAVPAMADTGGCTLNAALLDCGAKPAAISAALAHPDTLGLLKALEADDSFPASAFTREKFRRSLEAAHGAARRQGRTALRQYQRRQLSRTDYEVAQQEYYAALKTYRAGILAYHSGEWRDLKGSERD